MPPSKNGYEYKGDYHFEAKKLYAKHFEHRTDREAPRVFISELMIAEFSPYLQQTISEWIAHIPVSQNNSDNDDEYAEYREGIILQTGEFIAERTPGSHEAGPIDFRALPHANAQHQNEDTYNSNDEGFYSCNNRGAFTFF